MMDAALRFTGAFVVWLALAFFWGAVVLIVLSALAAAARQGGDVEQAPGEAPQSGPPKEGNAQPTPATKSVAG